MAAVLKHSAMRRASLLCLLVAVAGWALLAMAATSGADVQVDSASSSANNDLSAEQLEQLRAGSEKFEFQAEYALILVHVFSIIILY